MKHVSKYTEEIMEKLNKQNEEAKMKKIKYKFMNNLSNHGRHHLDNYLSLYEEFSAKEMKALLGTCFLERGKS